jgi:endonuclease YncB( thermonuclease family)
VVADVYSEKGQNPAKELLAAGLASAYDGKKKSHHFCVSEQKSDLTQN